MTYKKKMYICTLHNVSKSWNSIFYPIIAIAHIVLTATVLFCIFPIDYNIISYIIKFLFYVYIVCVS